VTPSLAALLRWGGLIGMAVVATLRALTLFAPQRYFDVDPAINPLPLAGLGPGGSLALDAILLLACAAALAGEAMAKRGIDWRLLALALIPAPLVLYHGGSDLGDLWRGSTWLAAAVAAATAAHLARHRIMRIALAAALFGVVGPMLARGALQVTVEHARTVEQFETQREEFLRDRGWEADSPAAQIYERRLRQPQPVGWFATTNIFASFMAAGLVMAGGLAIAAVKNRVPVGWKAGAALAGAGAAVMLMMSGSKGAVIAALIGAGLACAPLLFDSVRLVLARWGSAAVVALIAAALIGVALRGAALPEDFLGDRSLLFRWHYMTGSASIIAESPLSGVGPEGFQAAYMRHRPPRSPEEVASAHSVFIDWLAGLGAATLAWVALAVTLAWRSGAALRQRSEVASPDDSRAAVRVALAVTALGIIPAMRVEALELDWTGLLVRLVGAAAYVLIAVGVAGLARRVEGGQFRWALTAAAAAVLVHSQIEMTFTQPGAAVWAFMALGVAGSAIAQPRELPRLWAAALIGLPVALALWIGVTGAWPALVQESRIARAAEHLQREDAGAPPTAAQRERAAAMLREAYEVLPSSAVPLHAAARQLELAIPQSPPDRRLELLRRAIEHAEAAAERHGHVPSIGLRTALAAHLAAMSGREDDWEDAIAAARRIAEIDPHGNTAWQRFGDVLARAGHTNEAARAYERALAADDNFELDPLKQFPLRQRRAMERFIAATRDMENGEP
jgi:tetratricopeptide (TPR) repeat protein